MMYRIKQDSIEHAFHSAVYTEEEAEVHSDGAIAALGLTLMHTRSQSPWGPSQISCLWM